MKVFAAQYCDCTHESAMEVLSLHTTPEAAWVIVEAHRAEKKAEYMRIDHGRWAKRFPWTDEQGSGSEAWDVHEYEVLE